MQPASHTVTYFVHNWEHSLDVLHVFMCVCACLCVVWFSVWPVQCVPPTVSSTPANTPARVASLGCSITRTNGGGTAPTVGRDARINNKIKCTQLLI